MRVFLAEYGQQGRKKMFTGYRTRSEEQFTGERSFLPGDFPTSLPVEVEDSLGVLVELLTCLGEKNPTAQPLKQRLAECLFESLNTLTDRRLG